MEKNKKHLFITFLMSVLTQSISCPNKNFSYFNVCFMVGMTKWNKFVPRKKFFRRQITQSLRWVNPYLVKWTNQFSVCMPGVIPNFIWGQNFTQDIHLKVILH